VDEDMDLVRGGIIAERVKPLGLGWPNLISILRILLIPPILWLISLDTTSAYFVAAVVFTIGALSDGLDGYLARRWSMKTATGAWLDPLSDKVFIAAPAIVLSMVGRFPWWATVAIVARELVVSLLRWRLDTRSVSMPASRVAKAKTVSQLFAVGMSIAPLPSSFHGLTTGVIVLAVFLTIYSGVGYFLPSAHRVQTG
jgi:CDP-diacylglycerol---glycerol-3-phosphate 3-phosphatidyltransferase